MFNSAYVALACAFLGSDDWGTRELAEVTIRERAGDLSSWRLVRSLAAKTEDPEVRTRLMRAATNRTADIAQTMIPDDYPTWPEVDCFAGPQPWLIYETCDEVSRIVNQEEYDLWHAARTDLCTWIDTAGTSASDWGGQSARWDGVYKGEPYGVRPKCRAASRRMIVVLLDTTGDYDTLFCAVQHAIAEDIRSSSDIIRYNPDIRSKYRKLCPYLVNERYFKGK